MVETREVSRMIPVDQLERVRKEASARGIEVKVVASEGEDCLFPVLLDPSNPCEPTTPLLTTVPKGEIGIRFVIPKPPSLSK